MFINKQKRLLALVLALVMAFTLFPVKQVYASADTGMSTETSEYETEKESETESETESEEKEPEEKQAQTLTAIASPTQIYIGDKIESQVTSDKEDAQGALTYEVVEGAELIETDENFSENGKWTAREFGTVRIKATKAEDDKYLEASAEYEAVIKEYLYSSWTDIFTLTGEHSTGSPLYTSMPVLGLVNTSGAIYVIKSGDQWIDADQFNLMTVQGVNSHLLTIAQKNSDGTLSKIGTVSLDYECDTEAPELELIDPVTQPQPVYSKDGDAVYDTSRELTLKVTDATLDRSTVQLWVRVDGGAAFDALEPQNAQKLIDAGIEVGSWSDPDNLNIIFGKNDGSSHKYQLIRMYARDQVGHDTEKDIIDEYFYTDREAPKGSIGYDVKADESGKSKYATTVSGQIYDMSGIKSAEYFVNEADENGVILTPEQVKATADSMWKELNVAADTQNENYRFTIKETEKLHDTTFNVYVRVQDNCGHITYFNTDQLMIDVAEPDLKVEQDSTTAANEAGWHRSEIRYNVTASDSGSGLKRVEYTVSDSKNNTIVTEELEIDEDGNAVITIPADERFNGKDLKLTVKAWDNAGNDITSDEYSFSMDTVDPEASVELADDYVGRYFKGDVQARVKASDDGSGVVSARYQIVTGENPQLDEENWKNLNGSGIVDIPHEKYADVDVDVYVRVIDKAGNEKTVHLNDGDGKQLYIHTEKPQINITYGTTEQPDPEYVSKVSGIEYYDTNRIATITIKEHEKFWNPEKTRISVEVDGKKNIMPIGWSVIGDWVQTGKGADAVYTAQVVFNAGHSYKLSVRSTDLCGNENDGFTVTDDKSTEFVIDNTAPEGTVGFKGLAAGMDTVWNSVVAKEDYEISRFARDKVSIAGKLSDDLGGISHAEYYVSSEDGIIDVKDITEWNTINSLAEDGSFAEQIDCTDKNCVVYIRFTDYSGNVSYIGTNGVVIDTQKPSISISTPDTESGVYGSDVPVSVNVSDEHGNAVSSGIKKVSYRVMNMGQLTQEGELYNYDAAAESLSDLVTKTSQGFTVGAASNNSNEVQLEVTAVDNAGNEYTATQYIKIDITAPKVEVSYDNNSGDTSFANAVYFKAPRTATVKVTERNFDPAKVMADIKAEGADAPQVSGWTTVQGTGNQDDTVHIATIYYGKDADYTFGIAVKDAAGNSNEGVDYGSSLAPTQFTIDQTKPVIAVAYDNNSAENGNYYKDKRTATITITEHNFDAGRVVLNMTATDAGNQIAAPSISSWSDNGDTHTATISFTADGLYTWSMGYTDKAGNTAADLDGQTFYIDMTKPAVTVSGVTPGSANSTGGSIGLSIECTDTNFGTFTPALSATVYENGRFVRKTISGNVVAITNGERVEYSNLKEDGVYSLTCQAQDKAGNTYESVNIMGSDGNVQSQNFQQGESLINFSVNRDGSTFSLDENTMKLVENYYVQKAAHDVVVTETNPDEVVSCNIKVNGKELTEGTQFQIRDVSNGDGWHRYEYAVDSSVFDEEGQYNVVVESRDKADSVAYSDVKSVNIDFVVDRTAPTFTLNGIEENGKYKGNSQAATLMPKDDGGKLGHVKVAVLDKDGKETEVITDMSGDELLSYLEKNDGRIEFNMPKGEDSQLAIECADCSVDENGDTNTNRTVYKNITVSDEATPLSAMENVIQEHKETVSVLFIVLLAILALAAIAAVVYIARKKSTKAN